MWFDGCHSEEPFGYAQDKLRDEESRFAGNAERFFAFTPFRLRMTVLQFQVDKVMELAGNPSFLLAPPVPKQWKGGSQTALTDYS